MADEEQANSLAAFAYKHASFIISVLAGLVVFLAVTSRDVSAGNILFGWNVSAGVFVALSWRKMLRATVEGIRKRSADLDFSDTVLLALSIGAALASIAGIGIELHSIKEATPDVALARAGAAVLTILISWIFLHTLFTIHYAHYFYGGADEGGLKFPDGIEEPGYWDFLYFSFTIGVAAQTADVAVGSTSIRKLTLLHAVLSFLFNTTILALAINVGASLL
ncbi:UNVERIFIED_ORG: putative membrane protein [Rhizobium aethiopicum]